MGPQLSLTIMVHANSRWFVYILMIYTYIYILLVGGDWNHGILNDFPYIGKNHPK